MLLTLTLLNPQCIGYCTGCILSTFCWSSSHSMQGPAVGTGWGQERTGALKVWSVKQQCGINRPKSKHQVSHETRQGLIIHDAILFSSLTSTAWRASVTEPFLWRVQCTAVDQVFPSVCQMGYLGVLHIRSDEFKLRWPTEETTKPRLRKQKQILCEVCECMSVLSNGHVSQCSQSLCLGPPLL